MVSKGVKTKMPLAAVAVRGRMHLWRTTDPGIPCQVASQQSLTPFPRTSDRITSAIDLSKEPLDTIAMPKKIQAQGQ